MKKIIKLTESDLTRIIKRVIKENEENTTHIPKKYDEDVTKKNYKHGFYKLVYPKTPQYEIGDEVRVKDGRKIKIVTITDKEEIPYKNFGGNAFRPHSFKYEFK